MAIGIEHYPNIDTTDPTDYPKGQIKDDPYGISGTPINVETLGDYVQFFMRLLQSVSITANSQPENATNGYQYIDALEKLAMLTVTGDMAGAWKDPGGLFFSTTGGGTVSGFTVAYNKYQIIGKTLIWQVRVLGVTISGSPSTIVMNMNPSTGATYANAGMMQICGVYSASFSPIVSTLRPAGVDTQVYLQPLTGGTFTNGSNQNFYVEIRAELN